MLRPKRLHICDVLSELPSVLRMRRRSQSNQNETVHVFEHFVDATSQVDSIDLRCRALSTATRHGEALNHIEQSGIVSKDTGRLPGNVGQYNGIKDIFVGFLRSEILRPDKDSPVHLRKY